MPLATELSRRSERFTSDQFGTESRRFIAGQVADDPDLIDTRARRREEEEEAERRRREELGLDQGSLGTSIVNELVKAYGFRQDPRSGQWSWSLDTIKNAFDEDPIFSTIDWLAVAVPVVKWGTAVRAVSKGTGVAGRALQAGAFAAETPGSTAGKLVGRVFGGDVAKAAEVHMRGPGRGFQSGPQWLREGSQSLRDAVSNPVTLNMDDEYLGLMRQYGADPAETRGLYNMIERERLVESAATERTREELLRGWQRFGPDAAQREAVTRFMESAVDPSDAQVAGALGRTGTQLYKAQWDFRNTIHEEGFRLGLFGEETYIKNLKKYEPRLHQKYMERKRAGEAVLGSVRGGGVREGLDRFKARTLTDEESELMGRVMDPRVSVSELAKAGQVIARARWAENIGKSVIARQPREIVERLSEVARSGDPNAMKLYGVSDDLAEELRAVSEIDPNMVEETVFDSLATKAGWRRMEDMVADKKLKQSLPDELKTKLVDPLVADDIASQLEFLSGSKNLINRAYGHAMGFFRASKTAYNPATHFRNNFGSYVFRTLALGGEGLRTGPTKGFRAFQEGMESADFKEALRSGVVGSSFDNEIRGAMEEAYGEIGKLGGRSTAVDWLGNSKAAQLVQRGAGKAERLYRAEDEVWKLDSFLRIRDRLMKNGLSREEAISKATLEVNKYFPNFTQQSPLTNAVRGVVPFSSFITESMRVWKNAVVEKPHWAFFWNHVTDTAGKTLGAMGGFSAEEIDRAEEALPYYMEGKKNLLWPFRVDGKPVFMDMSYMIPMANIQEAAAGEATFFDMLQIDPTANPIIGTIAAAATGTDPFSGREVEPRFSERQLGLSPDSPRARHLLGLAEYAAMTMLPPLVPPSYAGTNLLELARGQKHPVTGAELEEGAARTLLANIAGIRFYEADVNSQLLNVRREERLMTEKIGQWWDRWEYAVANGNTSDAMKAKQEIIAARNLLRGDGEEYFQEQKERHAPGDFKTVTTRHAGEVLRRSSNLMDLDKEDRKMLTALVDRLQERAPRSKLASDILAEYRQMRPARSAEASIR